jgi:hypothetical protein
MSLCKIPRQGGLVLSVISGFVLCAATLSPDAAAAQPEGIEAATKSLAEATPENEEALVAALRTAAERLDGVPKIHTRAYAQAEPAAQKKAQMTADVSSLERLLEQVAKSTAVLKEADTAHFVSSLNILIDIKDKLAKPGAYGNLLGEMALGQYIARIGMARLFDSPRTAEVLEPVLSRNMTIEKQWTEWAKAISEEMRREKPLVDGGQVSISDLLDEILKLPIPQGLTLDTSVAERNGRNAAAFKALLTAGEQRWGFIPSHFDKVHATGLAIVLGLTQDVRYAASWWARFLKDHGAVPANRVDLRRKLEVNDYGAASKTSASTGKPFSATDLNGYCQGRRRLHEQALQNLTRKWPAGG